jgi:hypothetical protein
MPGLPLNATAKGRLVDPLAGATCNRPTAAVLAARIFLTTFRIDDDPTHHTARHPYFPPGHAAEVTDAHPTGIEGAPRPDHPDPDGACGRGGGIFARPRRGAG